VNIDISTISHDEIVSRIDKDARKKLNNLSGKLYDVIRELVLSDVRVSFISGRIDSPIPDTVCLELFIPETMTEETICVPVPTKKFLLKDKKG
jgi:hypothetical protein